MTAAKSLLLLVISVTIDSRGGIGPMAREIIGQHEGFAMGLFQDIAYTFKHGPLKDAQKLQYGRVENVIGWPELGPNISASSKQEPVKPGTAYFKWWLQEMWLPHDMEWLSHYHPLVYSQVKTKLGPKQVNIPMTLGEFKFTNNNSLKNLDNALRLNYEIMPLVPYNGGTVELSAALIGVRNQDGIGNIFQAVST